MGKRPAQGGHRLIVQQDDGVEPVLGLLASARHTLRTVQFTLDDPRFVNAVLDAHRRQVAVHVLLNPHKSSGERGNDATFEQLKRAGIAVEWTHPRFPVTHEKAIVIDDERALIASFNLSAKYFGETRDHGVLTDHPLQVRAIVSAFEADWRRKPFQPREDSGLVWSPDNARRLIAGFIDDARHTLDVQHPKFVDATVIDRLAAARSRGVKVRVLCGGKHGLSPWDLHDTFASLRILERVDVKVRRQKHLKVHAKLLLADGKRSLLGSMNLDRSAFDLRRELGVVVDACDIVERLAELFEHDWHKGEHWSAPDPLADETHDHGELPDDPHFVHE
ncbi:MAG: cardiolipin synthase [Deltaproteobacteria bacterium]|nr:MAG: cardiolipin synthase [Deltaproteobacteria bacterium]